MNAQVLGISVDHVPCLKAWATSLGGLKYPLLSDFWPHGKTAEAYGVLRPDGTSERALFVIDAQGVIRYIDIHAIDDQPDNEVLFAELEKVAGPEKVKWVRPPEEEELPHGGVVIYCTPWCPDCVRARAWLKSHQIPYREVNIEVNTRAARQVREWTGGNQTTPTFDIDGEILFDFDEQKLARVLLK